MTLLRKNELNVPLRVCLIDRPLGGKAYKGVGHCLETERASAVRSLPGQATPLQWQLVSSGQTQNTDIGRHSFSNTPGTFLFCDFFFF